jgi:serine protease Do
MLSVRLASRLGPGLALGSLLAAVPYAVWPSPASSASLAALETRPPSFAAIAKRTMPVVVNISTTAQRVTRSGSGDPMDEFFSRYFGESQPRDTSRRSLGSGILISKDGEILTSYHVVKQADAIKVKLADQSEYDARLVGKDDRTDLALIKILKTPLSLPFARLGTSIHLDVGDWVMTIGNPFGLEHTVTAGIVSAKGRVIGAGPYDNFIQTDASINPGNSGGPLINAAGEVVGVNSAIFSQTGGNIGIGFAIPIDLAKKVADQLRKNGKVVRGWFGIRAQGVSPQAAAIGGLTQIAGEIQAVTEVTENSPAAVAGLKVGDVIVEFNGKPLSKNPDLRTLIADTAPGQKATFKIVREKLERIVTVKIGELPEDGDANPQIDSRDPELGLRVQRITPETSRRLGLSSIKGVLVTEVQSGSPSEQVGIEPADVIREVNQRPVNNVKDFERAVRQGRRGDRILLLVQRGDNAVFFALKRRN